MSDYGKYIQEREAFEIVENSKGFATFKTEGEECYIRDIYVSPDHRKEAVASDMADKIAEIAKQRGCKFLTGSICPTTRNSTVGLAVLISYGFELHSAGNNFILMKKVLG
jgi:ribosomal protein S18 acetylase RimI-like enzyme